MGAKMTKRASRTTKATDLASLQRRLFLPRRVRLVHAAALILVFGWTLFSPRQVWAQLPPLPGSLVVSITSPTSGSTVAGTISVSASVSPLGVLVTGVQFRLDGVNLGVEDTSAPYSVPWDTTITINGSHTLRAVGRNALGVRFTSDPVTITVSNAPPSDTTPPAVTIASPTSGSTVSGTITVSADASDDVGVVGIQFQLDGADLGAEDRTPPYSVAWDTTTAADGSHGLAAVARDAAGNQGASATVTVTVANSAPPPPATGDIFVSLRSGQVQWRNPDGTLKQVLTSVSDGAANGMAFDGAGNLYVTHWSGTTTPGNTVARFDPDGNLLGTFGSGYNANPSSIVFDAAGNAYVGQADETQDILKFAPSGDLLAALDVAVEHRGSDWIDLASDQCTMLYTSREQNVLQYDVCGNRQLPNFNRQPLPGPNAFALRVLPDGGLVVANWSVIVRLDASGALVQTYGVPDEAGSWIGLDLVGDGTFWVSSFGSSNVYRIDLASGSVLASFNTGTPPSTVGGVAVKR